MSLDLILRVGTKLILPFILLFALYVQFHGEYGPGGGFQAGVISAGMVILLAITFGLEAAQRVAPQALVEAMVPIGVLIYAGTRGYLDKIDVAQVGRYEKELVSWLRSKKSDLLSAIVSKKDIGKDGIEDKIKAALDEFGKTFS